MKKLFVVLCASLVCALNVQAQLVASANENVECNGTVQITATAAEGFHFVKWMKGAEEFSANPLTISEIKAAAEYVAYFEANITDFGPGVTIDNPNPQVGNVITLTAESPDFCQEFDKWSDDNTENPRTITYDGTAPFTVVYKTKVFNVQVNTATGTNAQGGVSITVQ